MGQPEEWQNYAKGLQKLGQLGIDSLWRSLESLGQAAEGVHASPPEKNLADLMELLGSPWNFYEQTLGKWLQSPTLGYTRELNHQVFQEVDAWFQLQQASWNYQIVLLEVWVKAVEVLLRTLASERADEIQDWRELLRLWSQTFDRMFAEAFLQNEALKARGNFFNAAMSFRQHQQRLTEIVLKANDLPTRSEVDEIHHSLYELRKEIKTLRKEFIQSHEKTFD